MKYQITRYETGEGLLGNGPYYFFDYEFVIMDEAGDVVADGFWVGEIRAAVIQSINELIDKYSADAEFVTLSLSHHGSDPVTLDQALGSDMIRFFDSLAPDCAGGPLGMRVTVKFQ